MIDNSAEVSPNFYKIGCNKKTVSYQITHVFHEEDKSHDNSMSWAEQTSKLMQLDLIECIIFKRFLVTSLMTKGMELSANPDRTACHWSGEKAKG